MPSREIISGGEAEKRQALDPEQYLDKTRPCRHLHPPVTIGHVQLLRSRSMDFTGYRQISRILPIITMFPSRGYILRAGVITSSRNCFICAMNSSTFTLPSGANKIETPC